MDKILKGLRVIECGDFISAPYCGKLLADSGAEVIKVEPPVNGDESRSYGPFPGDIQDPEKSGLYLWLNAGKLGITLNLRTLKGRQIIRDLVESADIIVANYSPKCAREVGLSYNSLRRSNSGLIQASITPFGQTGPYKDYNAYHINCCAIGGVSIGIGSPDRKPLVMPMFQGHFQAGISAAASILIALIEREKSHKGQHVDISEAEVWATHHAGRHILDYIYWGVAETRRGNQIRYFWYPNCVLPCKDGYVVLSSPQIAQWTRFIKLMGSPKWAEEPRYRDRRAMHAQYPEEVDRLIMPWLAKYTKKEIFEQCRNNHIPFAPVYTIEDLSRLPHLLERDFFTEINHPQYGDLKVPGAAYKFSGTTCLPESPAPILGQHNEEVFCHQLGYAKMELKKLRERGVI